MKNLSISIIIPTFNSARTIEACLKSIVKQNYPKTKIEIIIVDGGSKDSTKNIVKKYPVKWIEVDPRIQNVELNKSIGIQKSKNDLVFLIDHDNVLIDKNLINEMVRPFIENADVIGAETLRYYYDARRSILDRYIALFAVTDPFAFYLGKADRLSYIYSKPDRKYNAKDCGGYYLINFNSNNLSTIGANGFMIRRDLLTKYAKSDPSHFYHTDVNLDLIKKGYKTYAFTKNSIAHFGGRGSIYSYLMRRMLFMRQYYLGQDKLLKTKRRYSLYTKKDFWKLIYIIIISLTFIKPTIDSLRGYLKIHDSAWFINPVLCFGFVVVYGYVVIEHKFKSIFDMS
ncbi:MAG TPA: glycosyltransferase [Patescibacteria group bacterium]|nr:glycosyltransferase [Patescibacteria group bacterium]